MKRSHVLTASLIGAVTALSVGLLPANAAKAGPGTYRQVNLPAPYAPSQITAGPDGNVWFTDNFHPCCNAPGAYDVGRVTPAGVVTTFTVPTPANPCQCVQASGITAGSDGNVWFTGNATASLYSISPVDGTITAYPLPGATGPNGPSAAQPGFVATGPDGNLWITDAANDLIDKVNPACVGCALTQYALPSSASCLAAGSCETPGAITAGPDGAMWFVTNAGLVGRIDMGGSVTQFLPPGGNPGLNGIAGGPNGDLWISVGNGTVHGIERLTPSGSFKFFGLPASQASDSSADPLGITAGPDGKLWFAVISSVTPAIDRMSVTGKTSIFPVPNAGGDPRFITAGPPNSNTVWATDDVANDIDIVSTK